MQADLLKPDFVSADWLLFTTEALINSVDPSIPVRIEKYNEKRYIIIEQVPISILQTLKFITNTDNNNNFLYPVEFGLHMEGSSTAIEMPGLNEMLTSVYRNSDALSFINGSKTHYPFALGNFTSASGTTSSSLQDFFTKLSGVLPKSSCPNLINKKLSLDIILNPDRKVIKYFLHKPKVADAIPGP